MIYTITLNPSLDYIISLKALKPGCMNRTENELLLPGGKGINVSVVLQNLGVKNTALGFTAGFTGDELQRMLKERGLSTDFVRVKSGMSRINVKVRAGKETELNGRGPQVSDDELEQLYEKLDTLLKDGDFLVLAGAVPGTLPRKLYAELLKRLTGRQGLKVVVDTSGESLRSVLPFRPFLIKPNKAELEELLGISCRQQEDILSGAGKMQELGARNVLVSLAGDGAVLLTEQGEALFCSAPEGEPVNSVGAGDSMVAGFLAGFLRAENFEEALTLGILCGSASTFSDGLATLEDVQRLKAAKSSVQIRRL